MILKLQRDLRETNSLFGEHGCIKCEKSDIPVEILSGFTEFSHYYIHDLHINIIFNKNVPTNCMLWNISMHDLSEELSSHDIKFDMSNGIPYIAFIAKNGTFKQKHIKYCIKSTLAKFAEYKNNIDDYSSKLSSIISIQLNGNECFYKYLKNYIKNTFKANYSIQLYINKRPSYILNSFAKKSSVELPNISFNITMDLNGNFDMKVSRK